MNTDIRDYIFKSSSSKDAKERANKVALQDSLQRFVGSFEDRVGQECYFLEKALPKNSFIIQRQQLTYFSSAIEIATGPMPEVNLLDMLTFVHLSGDRIKKFWIPEYYKEAGKRIHEAFIEFEGELWEIAEEITNINQKTKILETWESWKKKHPDLILVERVRLSEAAGVRGNQELHRVEGLGGIFHGVKEALSTADETYLLANRSLFYAQRLPTLIRLESRLATYQIIDDSLKHLSVMQGDLLMMQKELTPFVTQLNSLVGKSAGSLEEVNKLFSSFSERFPKSDEKSNLIPDAVAVARNFSEKLATSELSLPKLLMQGKSSINSVIWNSTLAFMAIIGFIAVIWWVISTI